ncbi:MAG: hypothetical protein EOO09_16595 [Chitinophagaceae bacterium]|nr:MAG: hypothetical protein EOO09_16595 [Chitinophagaceae bacterium]
MKKIVLIIVFASYLAFTCGVMVNFHYCMDKLASTQLFSSGSKQCGKCGMHMDDAHGCCRDEVQVVKMDDDQKPTAAIDLVIPTLEPLVTIPSPYLAASFYNFDEPYVRTIYPPPILPPQDLCVAISVFRI